MVLDAMHSLLFCKYLWIAYCVPSIVQSSLFLLNAFNPPSNLLGRYYYPVPILQMNREVKRLAQSHTASE